MVSRVPKRTISLFTILPILLIVRVIVDSGQAPVHASPPVKVINYTETLLYFQNYERSLLELIVVVSH